MFHNLISFSQPPPFTFPRLNFALPAPLNLYALQFLASLNILRLLPTTLSWSYLVLTGNC